MSSHAQRETEITLMQVDDSHTNTVQSLQLVSRRRRVIIKTPEHPMVTNTETTEMPGRCDRLELFGNPT